MNPIQAMLGPVCGKCVRGNHARAVGKTVKEDDGKYVEGSDTES